MDTNTGDWTLDSSRTRLHEYFQQRGIDSEEAIKLMISGFCRDVFSKLPMEFALEAEKLLELKLEKSLT